MENLQEIVALLIVAIAFSVGAFKLYKKYREPLKGCNGCASDCSGCQLQDLKKDIEKNLKQKNA